jgi:hypothetical protein
VGRRNRGWDTAAIVWVALAVLETSANLTRAGAHPKPGIPTAARPMPVILEREGLVVEGADDDILVGNGHAYFA